MYELDSQYWESVSGGLKGNVSNMLYGAVQGVPFGMYYFGKFGVSGGWLGAAVSQLIGVIWGIPVGAIGFGALGLFMAPDDFEAFLQQCRQVMLPGGTNT